MDTQKITDRLLFSFPEKQTDVGVLFGSRSISGTIARKGAELFHKGAFKKLVLTGGLSVREPFVLLALSPNFLGWKKPNLDFTNFPDFLSSKKEADYMQDVLLEHDVPEDAIILKDTASTNTGENVNNIKSCISEFNSIGLVATAYFQRRAMGTIRHHNELREQILVPHAVYPFGFTRENWSKTAIKGLVALEHERMEEQSPKAYVGHRRANP